MKLQSIMGAYTGPIHEVVYNVDGIESSEMIAQGNTVSNIPS